jgi:flagellar biosynthesis protein FlhF
MTTRRFMASDMSRALKKVREELGPDAIILSSKRADKGVEIIATIDDQPPSPDKAAKRRFAAAFDDEFDQPLESDSQWEGHHQAQRIAAKTPVVAIASGNSGHSPAGSESQTPPRLSHSTSVNAERLAKEIQVAHDRMLAAKSKLAQRNMGKETALDERQDPQLRATAGSHNQAEEAAPGLAQNRQVASFAEQVKARGLADELTIAQEAQMHSLYDEIAEMRMLLEEQLWQKQPSFSASNASLTGRARQLASQLELLGLPTALTKELLVCADENERLPICWRKALGMLARRLPIDPRDPIDKGGVFALVGPTGVGKTTTVAKLAARYVLNHGRGKVAIVTTDTYRVGAHDQLKALGRILQVPVRSIEGEHQLTAALASLKQYELVLVDTAGFRQGDAKQASQEALLDTCPGVQRVLVLAANCQQQILKASLHAYGNKPLRGCIFTKLDECVSLGEAIGAICSSAAPIIYTAAGQEIPDDIQVVSSTELISTAAKLARQFEGSGVSPSVISRA